MGLKKMESEIKTMLADTILAMCSTTLEYNSEISVEGLLGVTIDKNEVILVPINKMLRMGKHKVITSSTPQANKKHKFKKTRVSSAGEDDLPSIQYGKRKRKMTWKMRESMSGPPGGDVDHAYTSYTSPEKNRKKKRKSISEMGITPLTSSSESDDDIGGFDDPGHDSDFDTSRDMTDHSQPQQDSGANTPRISANTTRTENKDKNDPGPSTSHDADLLDGLSVANLEQQLNSTAEDVLQGAQEVVGEVVETEDGQLVIKLGEMNPPLLNSQGIPYDVGQTSGQANYRVIKGGTTMGRDMLTDGLGFSYAISREKKSLKDGGPETVYWRCSVRASAQQRLNGGICCNASVVERSGIYRRGETPHCHAQKEDLHARLLIGKMVREKARMLENLSIPSSHIFQEAAMAAIQEDPSVSYESIAKYKSLFERRFNRARKECISSKTKIPNIGIRHLVRATQQHIRDEKKSMKLQQLQPPEDQQPEQVEEQQQAPQQILQAQQLHTEPQQVQQTHQHIQLQPQLQPQRVQIIVTQNR